MAAFFCENFCWEFLWLLLTLMCVGNYSEENPYNCPNLLKCIYRFCQVNFAAFWEANKTCSVEKRPQKPVIYMNWPLAKTVECFSLSFWYYDLEKVLSPLDNYCNVFHTSREFLICIRKFMLPLSYFWKYEVVMMVKVISVLTKRSQITLFKKLLFPYWTR